MQGRAGQGQGQLGASPKGIKLFINRDAQNQGRQQGLSRNIYTIGIRVRPYPLSDLLNLLPKIENRNLVIIYLLLNTYL